MAVLNKKGGRVPADAVYIGRPSKWGNPYMIGPDGTREQVIEAYKGWLTRQYAAGALTVADFASLHGKDLACWCAPLPCHGHVLERWAARAAAKLSGK
jgi:hypothetical protein